MGVVREVEAKKLARSFSTSWSSSLMEGYAAERAFVLIFGYLAEGDR